MKYFIDTEFLEGTQERPLILKGRLGNWMIGYPKPTIDLISIGIVAEDGREYYAISKDFNLKEAWNRFDIKRTKTGNNPYKDYWIRDNVLKLIWEDCFLQAEQGDWYAYAKDGSYEIFVEKLNNGVFDNLFTFKSLEHVIKKYGKTNEQIAEEVKEFNTWIKVPTGKCLDLSPREFYGYYADYDWVVFCWLFGTMMNLPDGFPKYCIDLKQMLDEKQKSRFGLSLFDGKLVNDIKKLPNYPKQTNEHNALSDARFNFELYKFLQQL